MLWEMLGVCLFGNWMMSREEKQRKKINERRSQWLKENGYDRKKQSEIECSARKNMYKAIEEAYGLPVGSVENYKMHTAWLTEKPPFSWEKMMKKLCEKNGIKFFNTQWPPKEYRNIE